MSPAPTSSVPEPRLRAVENLTRFAAFQCDKMGPGRRFHDTVVIKGTFTGLSGKLRVADQQAPVVLADHPWDPAAPERSSVKLSGDVVLSKPSTDILITGAVRPPGGRPRAAWDVTVVVQGSAGPVLSHLAQVTGPRAYRHGSLRGWTLSDPDPAMEVPIRYELAYGGAYPDPRSRSRSRAIDQAADDPAWVMHWPNPSGTGFFDQAALDTGRDYPAPQWQIPGQPARGIREEVPLCGLGPIARHWTSRRRWAGTYDEAWLDRARADIALGLPADYPADFDLRFFQAAHPGLITREHLAGHEILALQGVSAEHDWLVVPLPGVAVQARLLDGASRWHLVRMPLDTIHLDLDAAALHLTWRLTLDQQQDMQVAVISALEA